MALKQCNFPLDRKGDLIHLVAFISPMRPRPVYGVILKSWDQMPVAVKNRLPGHGTIIHNEIESVGSR
jgi:hypothetical protein